MLELLPHQYILIGLLFIWSGIARSGLGFGGAVFTLPFLLMIVNNPLIWLPIISAHLLFFSAITVFQSHKKTINAAEGNEKHHTIDWKTLRWALSIIIIPKIIGVLGLVSLPTELLSGIIFTIVIAYSITYILNISLNSKSDTLDFIFLALGGYISGTSLIGAPLIIAVLANHINRHQLRDSLFVLWFILVGIKVATFIYFDIDLQLIHHLWLLPCAGIGHLIGLKVHKKILESNPKTFYRLLGCILFVMSTLGLIGTFI